MKQRERDSLTGSLGCPGQTGTCGCHCAAQMLPAGGKIIFLMLISLQVLSSLPVSLWRRVPQGAEGRNLTWGRLHSGGLRQNSPASPKHIFLFLCCSVPSVPVHPSQASTFTSPDKAKHSQEEPTVRMELHVLLIPHCS